MDSYQTPGTLIHIYISYILRSIWICVIGIPRLIPGAKYYWQFLSFIDDNAFKMSFSLIVCWYYFPEGDCNQDPRWSQKLIYNTIFTHHIWSWLMCVHPRKILVIRALVLIFIVMIVCWRATGRRVDRIYAGGRQRKATQIPPRLVYSDV